MRRNRTLFFRSLSISTDEKKESRMPDYGIRGFLFCPDKPSSARVFHDGGRKRPDGIP